MQDFDNENKFDDENKNKQQEKSWEFISNEPKEESEFNKPVQEAIVHPTQVTDQIPTPNESDFRFDKNLESAAEKSLDKSEDFFKEARISSDYVDTESLGLKEPHDATPVNGQINRDYIDKEDAATIDIQTKKYKLWSLENISKNNKFLPIVMPLINDEIEVPSGLSQKSMDELKRLLEFKFNTLFKEYIRDSKVCKLKLETKFDDIIRKLEKDYQDFKSLQEHEHFEKVKLFDKTINVFDTELNVLRERLTVLSTDVKTDISIAKRKKGILLLTDNEEAKNEAKKENEIPEEETVRKASEGDLSHWNDEIKAINNKIDAIVEKKDKVYSKTNKENLEFTNRIDAVFIQKEKDKTQLEVDKIEILIFLRENLVALNRVIRDIKIQIGIQNIQSNNERTGKIFDDIADALNRTKKQFELLDGINRTENKIIVEQSIDTSTRIVNLKTGESI